MVEQPREEPRNVTLAQPLNAVSCDSKADDNLGLGKLTEARRRVFAHEGNGEQLTRRSFDLEQLLAGLWRLKLGGALLLLLLREQTETNGIVVGEKPIVDAIALRDDMRKQRTHPLAA